MSGVGLTVSALAVTATLAIGCATAGSVASVSAHLAGIADAAALAAADAVSGAATGIPCERAAGLAERGGADLVRCDLDGLIATIEVTASVGAFTVRARARAGPAP